MRTMALNGLATCKISLNSHYFITAEVQRQICRGMIIVMNPHVSPIFDGLVLDIRDTTIIMIRVIEETSGVGWKQYSLPVQDYSCCMMDSSDTVGIGTQRLGIEGAGTMFPVQTCIHVYHSNHVWLHMRNVYIYIPI